MGGPGSGPPHASPAAVRRIDKAVRALVWALEDLNEVAPEGTRACALLEPVRQVCSDLEDLSELLHGQFHTYTDRAAKRHYVGKAGKAGRPKGDG